MKRRDFVRVLAMTCTAQGVGISLPQGGGEARRVETQVDADDGSMVFVGVDWEVHFGRTGSLIWRGEDLQPPTERCHGTLRFDLNKKRKRIMRGGYWRKGRTNQVPTDAGTEFEMHDFISCISGKALVSSHYEDDAGGWVKFVIAGSAEVRFGDRKLVRHADGFLSMVHGFGFGEI